MPTQNTPTNNHSHRTRPTVIPLGGSTDAPTEATQSCRTRPPGRRPRQLPDVLSGCTHIDISGDRQVTFMTSVRAW